VSVVPGIGRRVVAPAEAIRTLIVTGHTDIHHDWRTMSPMLAELLTSTGRFDVRITEEFRGAGPETLEPYDLVVLNYFGRFEPWGREPEIRWGRRAEQALYDHVAAGKGCVVYHASLQMARTGMTTSSAWLAASCDSIAVGGRRFPTSGYM
jgi:hypothetical protein